MIHINDTSSLHVAIYIGIIHISPQKIHAFQGIYHWHFSPAPDNTLKIFVLVNEDVETRYTTQLLNAFATQNGHIATTKHTRNHKAHVTTA